MRVLHRRRCLDIRIRLPRRSQMCERRGWQGSREEAESFRLRLERYISDNDVSGDHVQTPQLLVVVGGDVSTLEHVALVLEAADHASGTALPCLIVADSGGAAVPPAPVKPALALPSSPAAAARPCFTSPPTPHLLRLVSYVSPPTCRLPHLASYVLGRPRATTRPQPQLAGAPAAASPPA